MKKKVGVFILAFLMVLSGCNQEGSPVRDKSQLQEEVHLNHASDGNNVDNENQVEAYSLNPDGTTLETRFPIPKGYERTTISEGSLAHFLRGYEMKEDGADVLLYNGRNKGNQWAHAAVFTLPIERADLQQCADSVMRMYAEYYWHSGQANKIAFHFTNGFLCEYAKWREGYRVVINGNHVGWNKSANYDDSYETFVKYMRMVFSYAGTLSMETYETEIISLSQMTVGDVIIKGGSPGHVVMVVDICENKNGKKAFLLAQGYMPAQEFHVIVNPQHDDDPWYYEEEMQFPLETAEYTFSDETMIRRLLWSE